MALDHDERTISDSSACFGGPRLAVLDRKKPITMIPGSAGNVWLGEPVLFLTAVQAERVIQRDGGGSIWRWGRRESSMHSFVVAGGRRRRHDC
jgi:hypothetical protein